MKKYFLYIFFIFLWIQGYAQNEEQTLDLASESFRTDDYAEAIISLDKVIQQRPDFADAYYFRGSAKNELGKYEEALKDFSKAIELNPDFADAYYNRAAVRNRLENYEGALHDYNKVIDLDTANAKAYYNRSYVKFLLRFTRGAILEDLNKAITLTPNDPNLYARRAFIISSTYDPRIDKVNYEACIKDISKAITLDPDNAEYYKIRGKCKFKKGENLGATADFNKAITLSPEDPDLYNERGLVKLKIEDYAGAVKDFSRALKLEQDLEYLFRNRGMAYYNLGNYYRAIEDYTKAIDLIEKQYSFEKPKANDRYRFILTNAYLLRGASFVALNKNLNGCEDFKRARGLGEKRAGNYIRRYCR